MNLSDLLHNYKTNPKDEIKKINGILARKGYVSCDYVSLKDYLRTTFLNSEYASYETSFDLFCSNVILNISNYNGLLEEEMYLSQYCLICELIMNLMEISNNATYEYEQTFEHDIDQLIKIINKGLGLCGYKLIQSNNVYATQKIDIEAESVAAINKTYQDDIYDYLIAKNIKDKETALTSLSIKLDAMEPNNNYVKQNKKYVQLLRHKEEKDIQEKYAWFFKKEDYNANLEKLFRIFLFMIAYNNCSDYLKDFENKTAQNKN